MLGGGQDRLRQPGGHLSTVIPLTTARAKVSSAQYTSAGTAITSGRQQMASSWYGWLSVALQVVQFQHLQLSSQRSLFFTVTSAVLPAALFASNGVSLALSAAVACAGGGCFASAAVVVQAGSVLWWNFSWSEHTVIPVA